MVSELTENECLYLKLIYREQREEFRKLGTTRIAKLLGIQPPTVTEVLKNLAEKGILRHRSYHGVELTKKGIIKAKELLRRHRLLEVLLFDYLNYSSNNACDEASKLDYYVTNDLVNTIYQAYDHPKACPCGKEIPPDRECEDQTGNGGAAD